MTPEFAAKLLERNEGNRPLKPKTVATYVEDMKNGRWSISDSMICVSPDGKLLNGQHRLNAVIKAGVSVTMPIMWNCPESAYANMDTGAKRSACDLFHHHGISNYTEVAAICHAVIHYRKSNTYSTNNVFAYITSEASLEEYKTHSEQYEEAVKLARRSKT